MWMYHFQWQRQEIVFSIKIWCTTSTHHIVLIWKRTYDIDHFYSSNPYSAMYCLDGNIGYWTFVFFLPSLIVSKLTTYYHHNMALLCTICILPKAIWILIHILQSTNLYFNIISITIESKRKGINCLINDQTNMA